MGKPAYAKAALYEHTLRRYGVRIPVKQGEYVHPMLELVTTPIKRFSEDQTAPVPPSSKMLKRTFPDPEAEPYFKDVVMHLTKLFVYFDASESLRKKDLLSMPMWQQTVDAHDPLYEWVNKDYFNIVHIPLKVEPFMKDNGTPILDDKNRPVLRAFEFEYAHDMRDLQRMFKTGQLERGVVTGRSGGYFQGHRFTRALWNEVDSFGMSELRNLGFLFGQMPVIKGDTLKRKGRMCVIDEDTWAMIIGSYMIAMDPHPDDSALPVDQQVSPYQRVLAELERRGPYPGILLSQEFNSSETTTPDPTTTDTEDDGLPDEEPEEDADLASATA